MSERAPNFKSQSLNAEKELKWENILKNIEMSLAGIEGMEEAIKEPVRALNAMGLPTTNSCEGHDNHGRIVPWVSIAAPDISKERCVGQKEFEEKVLEEKGVSKELLEKYRDYSKEYGEEMRKLGIDNLEGLHEKTINRHGISDKDIEKVVSVFGKAEKEIDDAVKSGILKETPEYVQWKEENKKLLDKASGFLKEFYKKRVVPENVKLILDSNIREWSGFLIRNDGGGDYVNLDEKMTDEGKIDYEDILEGRITQKEKEELKARIELYRK